MTDYGECPPGDGPIDPGCCKACEMAVMRDVPTDQHEGPCDTCRVDAHLRRVAASRAEVDRTERDRLAEAERARATAVRQLGEVADERDRLRQECSNHLATLAHMKDAAGIALEWYDDGAIETGVDIAAYRRLRDWVHGGPRRHAPVEPLEEA